MSGLAGQNAAAIRDPAGEWEVLQFEAASLIGTGTYELSGLLRGQLGTEAAMQAVIPAGARFVLIAASLARIDLQLGEIGLPYSWRFGPSSRDIGSSYYAERTQAFRGIGLRPYAPVHIRAGRSAGDVSLTWVRRTRIGGDTWEPPDVPLGEESERYEIDILQGSSVKRTLQATSASAIYSAAQQVADFGSVQTSLSVRIYQISAAYGRGSPATAVV